MVSVRDRTCCFTGHRPEKLPWGSKEWDPRCAALKRKISWEIQNLYQAGYLHFISGMARGCDLYCVEAVLALREFHPDITVEAALPCLSQADRWPPEEQRRWRAALERCDTQTVIQREYDRFCMHRRDRYMVDHSSVILAIYDGTPGGTRYTLDRAAAQRLEIRLLDPVRPEAPAVRLLP